MVTNNRGITVIELISTLAIISILIAILIPSFSLIREKQLLKNTMSDVVSLLEKARSKTLGSVDSSEYGVHFQSDQVIIFKGKVFSSSAVDNEIIYVVNPISISNVTLDGVSGTSGDVYFNRLYGVPSSVGTITISAPSAVKIITISITGTISVN